MTLLMPPPLWMGPQKMMMAAAARMPVKTVA
jgi:hypothetical protein